MPGAVAAMALTAILAVPPMVAAADPAPGRNLTICHATHSDSNPYQVNTPNINATGLHGGHDTHTGPIWDATLKKQHIAWGDIIPPFDYTNKGQSYHFDGLNWTDDGQAIWDNNCTVPPPVQVAVVAPQSPVVTQSACVAGSVTAPGLALASTEGVVYSVDPVGPYVGGQQVTVTAAVTDADAFEFVSPLADGWQAGTVAGTATLSVTFDADPPCDPPVVPDEVVPDEVVPDQVVSATPVFADNVCLPDGLAGAGYTLPDRDGVTFSVDGAKTGAGTYAAADGSSVTVRAIPRDGLAMAGGVEVFTHTFADTPPCLAVDAVSFDQDTQTGHGASAESNHGVSSDAVSAESSDAELAQTGVSIVPMLRIGAGMAIAGAGLVLAMMLIERRRA